MIMLTSSHAQFDDPWPFNGQVSSKSFIDEFNVNVDYDVSGGWLAIVILFAIEITVVYFAVLDKA